MYDFFVQLQINDNSTGTKKNLNIFYFFVTRPQKMEIFWGKMVNY